jgi:hypothetical protein
MKSKFEIMDNRPFREKVVDFSQSMLFWRGRSKGSIYTRDIDWSDIKEMLFPQSFEEKYGYLGSVPYDEKSEVFKAMYPLILAMDYEAKPKWCPRWVLRFLHLFGSDNSIVRVRNRYLSNLKRRLTKGIQLTDYKTKWEYYDLRISVYGTDQMQDLADAIEHKVYSDGLREDLADQIKELNPKTKYDKGYSIDSLRNELNRLENDNSAE